MSRNRAFRRITGGIASDYVGDGIVMLLDGADTSTMTRTGTRVDEWRDKLGSGNKVETSTLGTGSNPVYTSSLFSNAGGVRFVDKVLETSSAFTTMNWANGWTILIAGQHTNRLRLYGVSDGGTYGLFGSGKSCRFGWGESWATKEQLPLSTNAVFGSMYTVAQVGPPVVAAELKYIRDGDIFTVNSGTTSVGTGAFGKLQIGGAIGTGFMSMDIRAMVIYNRELSSSEVTRMCRWMKSVYNMGVLPTDTWNFAVDGEDLCLGYGSNGPSWAVDSSIRVKAVPYPQRNIYACATGKTIQDAIDDAPTLVDPYYNTDVTAKKRICIVWFGSNDIKEGLLTNAEISDKIFEYCTDRKNVGWKVILLNVLSRSDSGTPGTFNTSRSELNSYLGGAVAGGYADAYCDLASDATVGVDGAETDPVLSGDLYHWTSLAQGIIRGYIDTAIDTVTA